MMRFLPISATLRYRGIMNRAVEFAVDNQLKDVALWKRLAEQFAIKSDSADCGWRGEFWGKLMRGGSVVYKVVKDDGLYAILKDSVCDVLNSANENGAIASYNAENEFTGWDIWARKYVMLGLLYFREICREDGLAKKIDAALGKQADYITERIGAGKKSITDTSESYGGLNSCTILEPFVKLYKLTGKEKYLSFARYIVDEGGCKDCDLIELALDNKLCPYEYPVKKCYEMMSFFEGVLEYYSVTGEEKYFTAVKNFASKVAESDLSIIGCSGTDGEEFNHSSLFQTEYNKIMQETCVTVTWIKLCTALYKYTSDVRYIDLIENSAYNALYSSVNFGCNRNVEYIPDPVKKVFLPFDSYSPLRCNRRGIVPGGYRLLSDNTYYGCCASIGAVGIGLIPLVSVMKSDEETVFNLYERGEIRIPYSGGETVYTTETEFPLGGRVDITVSGAQAKQNICLRVPDWMENVSLTVNGEELSPERKNGYVCINRTWKNNDKISLVYTPKLVYYELNGRKAIRKGCLVYARDERFGEPIDEAVNVKRDENGNIEWRQVQNKAFDCYDEIEVSCNDGHSIHLCDYISAGSNWDGDKNTITVWM